MFTIDVLYECLNAGGSYVTDRSVYSGLIVFTLASISYRAIQLLFTLHSVHASRPPTLDPPASQILDMADSVQHILLFQYFNYTCPEENDT